MGITAIKTKQLASALGFTSCGIAKAVPLDEDARRLEQWLQQGFHGGMQYMENHFDLRINPTRLVPGARSVITLLMNYYPGSVQQHEAAPKISRYAWGEDYHEVIRSRLGQFLVKLREEAGAVEGRGFVDSAPVLERAWAQRSGLGWIGKNGNLISPKSGSWYFIATLITDLELEPDAPLSKDYCGSCTRCIDACPTQAILPGNVVDGSRCISYFTIELKAPEIDGHSGAAYKDWMFGCDICQEVCPWNRFSKPHQEPAFSPIPEILNLSTGDWEAMTETFFKEVFRRSPLKRARHSGIQRNLRFIKKMQ